MVYYNHFPPEVEAELDNILDAEDIDQVTGKLVPNPNYKKSNNN